jgi:hypothetical protein
VRKREKKGGEGEEENGMESQMLGIPLTCRDP